MGSEFMGMRLQGRILQYGLERFAKHGPLFFKMVLVVALFHSLARFGWGVVEFWQAPSDSSTTDSARHSEDVGAGSGFSPESIGAMHLFGYVPPPSAVQPPPPPPPPVAPPSPPPPPPVPLNATLRGILFFAAAPQKAMAIIQDGASRTEEGYRVGGWLPERVAQVAEIHPDRVVVDYQGRKETLLLPQDVGSGGLIKRETPAVANQPTAPQQITMIAPPPPPPPPLAQAKPVPTASPDAAAVRLGEIRKMALTQPDEVMSLLSYNLVFDGPNFLGVKLYEGRDKDLLRLLGLQPGDLITHVNGIALTSDPADLITLYNDMESLNSVAVRVTRGMENILFNFPIAK